MVKKVLSAVALASVVAATPAMAQTGGFTGPGATQEGTVAQLKTLPDDAHMILKGNIVRNVQGDKYEFKDATGTVELEIDRKLERSERQARKYRQVSRRSRQRPSQDRIRSRCSG